MERRLYRRHCTDVMSNGKTMHVLTVKSFRYSLSLKLRSTSIIGMERFRRFSYFGQHFRTVFAELALFLLSIFDERKNED